MERRLAAILSADVVGYSRLMETDEAGALAALNAHRQDVVEPKIFDHHGRIVKLMGDGVLVEFASVVDAVNCAVQIQTVTNERRNEAGNDGCVALRIGVHLGDVIVENDDIFGDGVNLSARLQVLAEPGGISISGTAHDMVQGELRRQFSDMGVQRVKNIARPVRVWRWLGSDQRASPAEIVGSVGDPLRKIPAIAVLPFVKMSEHDGHDYFSDGLTEDLINALSHWRNFPVIARNSTFTYKGRAVRVQQVAWELGARYVVEGSVRREGQRLRITVQLIDAESGHHVWSERYDRLLQDIFDVQDEIAASVAATLAPELELIELRKSTTKRTEDLSAWDFYVRGMAQFHRETCDAHAQAREMFEQALACDPNYAEAWARLGWTHVRDFALGCSSQPDHALAKGFETARRAVELDEASAVAHMCLGTAHIWAEELDLGLSEAERALELNPSYAHAAMAVGNRLDLIGRTAQGIAQMERGLQLNPCDPSRWKYMLYLARAHTSLGEHDLALSWARRAIALRPNDPAVHFRLSVCLANLGNVTEACRTLNKCEELQPGYTVAHASWRPYPDRERNEIMFAGLRRYRLLMFEPTDDAS